MKKSMKKTAALVLTAAMAMGVMTGCGGSSGTASTAGQAGGSEAAGAVEVAEGTAQKISFLNSKGEIQAALEDMAQRRGALSDWQAPSRIF